MRIGIQTERELQVTREKLRILEEEYEAARLEPCDDEEVREAELQSLKGLINQLEKGIARFWARRFCCPSDQLQCEEVPPQPLERRVSTSMIPQFDSNGNLPAGLYQASLAEIEERFGRESELRRVEMQSLYWLIDLARRLGIVRMVIDGSFVTETPEPNDVDCVLLIGRDYPRDSESHEELLDGLPFLDIQIVDEEGFERFVRRIFATDRRLNPRGLVEVVL